MTSQNELAGTWVRVSTGGQDEANQVPDIEQYCKSKGYRIVPECRYELNDKSASKGEQQDKQDEAIGDIREGRITVLVCWHSDRVERRGPEALFGFLRKIKDAGGRLESTKEPLLGTEDLSGEAVTALNAVIAHQYSVHLGEQVKSAQARIRANQALVAGGTPWGYKITGEKYHKTIVPDEAFIREVDGEPKHYAADIFERCALGDSCRTIARWLDSEKIPTIRGGKWSEGSVYRIITNMTYAGRRQDEGDIKPNGKPSRKNRQTIMTCDAVIGMDLWQRANDALHNRPRRGPGVKLPDRPMLAGLKCAQCGGPMWRINVGRPNRRVPFYRCYGVGPQRRGCGNMVHYEMTDHIVVWQIIEHSTEPYKIRVWREGTSFEDQIASTKQDLREALEAERWADMPDLQAKLNDLRDKQEHATKGYYDTIDMKMTVGQYFDTLDLEGKREYLKTRDIRVEKADPLLGPAWRAIRVVIDDDDLGVFPYPLESTVGLPNVM